MFKTKIDNIFLNSINYKVCYRKLRKIAVFREGVGRLFPNTVLLNSYNPSENKKEWCKRKMVLSQQLCQIFIGQEQGTDMQICVGNFPQV